MNKPLKIDKYTVHYHNKEETLSLKTEIFSQHTYYFEANSPQPKIIDAGAHIGLATLYFKKQYPMAQITAIEPHPVNFKLLEQNVWENALEDVSCLQVALAEEAGLLTMHADTTNTWLSTVSVNESAWNGQQQTRPVQVPAITLSSLLTQPIDLLKLDIEGAESRVLKEAGKALKNIQLLLIEFHPRPNNVITELAEYLEELGFSLKYSKNGGTISAAQAFNRMVMIEATHQS